MIKRFAPSSDIRYPRTDGYVEVFGNDTLLMAGTGLQATINNKITKLSPRQHKEGRRFLVCCGVLTNTWVPTDKNRNGTKSNVTSIRELRSHPFIFNQLVT